jgi:hypothetical protein
MLWEQQPCPGIGFPALECLWCAGLPVRRSRHPRPSHPTLHPPALCRHIFSWTFIAVQTVVISCIGCPRLPAGPSLVSICLNSGPAAAPATGEIQQIGVQTGGFPSHQVSTPLPQTPGRRLPAWTGQWQVPALQESDTLLDARSCIDRIHQL